MQSDVSKPERKSRNQKLNVFKTIVYVFCEYIFARKAHKMYFAKNYVRLIPSDATPEMLQSMRTPVGRISPASEAWRNNPLVMEHSPLRHIARGDSNCFFNSVAMVPPPEERETGMMPDGTGAEVREAANNK